VRKTAARLLSAIIDAHTSLDGLTDAAGGHPQYRALDVRDRALVRAILTTALRFHVTIEKLIERELDRPLPGNAHALSHILHVAAAQILFLDIPDSAAVDLAVSHAKGDPRTARFGGLVNGVLRALARSKDKALPEMLAATEDAPDWFRQRLVAAYGEEKAGAILAAHRIEAPTDFTVRADPEKWAVRLGGIVLPTGTVRVERLAAPVPELPGYGDGAWWVQDAAASLPARLLGDVSGARVADLCAAPGGKTAQLVSAGARVTAVDISSSRLNRLAVNLGRLGLEAQIVTADLMKYEPAQPFDAVLLDAPCSSTGTVRRHPDVPWTKTPADIEKLAEVQFRLLGRAVELVRPGGRVVFSNCSLDPAEGEALLERFLAGTEGVRLDPIRLGEAAGIDPFITARGTLRTTPAELGLGTPALSGMDGFFAARLVRLA
jgi:16S rRNA (cytosine967-C5)-methyltransferase